MSDTTSAFLRSWEFRPIIILLLSFFGFTFTLGWWRLRNLAASRKQSIALAKPWRLISYWGGLLLIFLALASPIEVLSGQLFLMHMIQHLLIAMFAPPLLLIANPMPIIMWGLPLALRKRLGALLFAKNAPARPFLKATTRPIIAWFLFFAFLWGWHDGDAYNLALRSDLAHDIEHITFFYPAMLLWWHITGAAPVLHKRFSYPGRIAFTLGCIPANMIAGVLIALAETVLYTHYETLPFRTWGISVLEDQRIGGAIMWVPGSMMYVIAVVTLVTLWMRAQEREMGRSRGGVA